MGWQNQTHGPSVQEALERSLACLCGHPVTVMGAGRTDSGVHAFGQVAHFDTDRPRSESVYSRALNASTPSGLSILDVREVPDTFDARRSAIYREYHYRILTRKVAPALDRRRVWHYPKPLDVVAMQEAGFLLLGTHDFSSFRASSCQSPHPIRTLTCMTVESCGEEIHLRVGCKGFLHHMVRNITGSLVLVGEGKWTQDHFKKVLEQKDRKQAGVTAPAWGLYLDHILYDV